MKRILIIVICSILLTGCKTFWIKDCQPCLYKNTDWISEDKRYVLYVDRAGNTHFTGDDILIDKNELDLLSNKEELKDIIMMQQAYIKQLEYELLNKNRTVNFIKNDNSSKNTDNSRGFKKLDTNDNTED